MPARTQRRIPKIDEENDVYVRLKPYRKDKGFKVKNYYFGGIMLRQADGWKVLHRVKHAKIIEHLQAARQDSLDDPYDPDTPPLCDVCFTLEEVADVERQGQRKEKKKTTLSDLAHARARRGRGEIPAERRNVPDDIDDEVAIAGIFSGDEGAAEDEGVDEDEDGFDENEDLTEPVGVLTSAKVTGRTPKKKPGPKKKAAKAKAEVAPVKKPKATKAAGKKTTGKKAAKKSGGGK